MCGQKLLALHLKVLHVATLWGEGNEAGEIRDPPRLTLPEFPPCSKAYGIPSESDARRFFKFFFSSNFDATRQDPSRDAPSPCTSIHAAYGISALLRMSSAATRQRCQLQCLTHPLLCVRQHHHILRGDQFCIKHMLFVMKSALQLHQSWETEIPDGGN